MKLYSFPFELIESEKKLIEIRLNDPKRQLLSIGDFIEFSLLPNLDKKITVKITSLHKYPDFASLVEDTPLEYGGPHWKNKKEVIQSGLGFYSEEKEKKYGYLKIGIELLKNRNNA
ncbi:hypothetical protein BALOs_2739 [Halobacteriovorax sp. BALOs_7]|uniref:ASCH domain-containing protein n=1 Tax=Halobacteriovorax sp. BALOs_7 TaxID=2109558 RepID=UPI000EA36135|nr:ASCH domain-containing protein [Halobacteriovorax sp. BALOs_7]AYF45729.1 hypothetical protein BALOs_2739 [Halobacteriovorax sp. BALOs_7]